jgi:hypothetical protein
MSGSLKHRGAFFLLAIAPVTLALGCAPNESSLFIRQCQVVPQDTCEVTADPSAAFKPSGILDVAFAGRYTCPLLVGNQLVTRGDPDLLRTETSRVEITSADVTLLGQGGGSLGKHSNPASGFIDPSTGAQPGYGLVQVVLIDSTPAVGDVVAQVVLHGRTLGGTELTTGEWKFPIHICQGCLCDTSTCGATDAPPTNCHVGTDAPVDCRLKLAGCP